MLAFVVGTGNVANVAPSEILVVPTTGGVPTPITDSVHLNTSPVFTPDGRGVLFVSSRSGGRDVFEQLLQGRAARGAPVRLTTGANATSLSLSADGKTLVYAAEVMRSNIWSAPIASAERAPARELRQVTFGDQEIECISVSRDGSWLLYDSNKSGNQDIYKIPVAGGEPILLTTDLADDFCGMTSPDGREIAFYSFRPDGNRRVYTMLADGGRQQPALDGGARGLAVGSRLEPGRPAAGLHVERDRHPTYHIVSRDEHGGWGDRRDLTRVSAIAVRWSRDGRYFATASDSGVIVISPDGRYVRVVVPRNEMGGEVRGGYVVWGPDSFGPLLPLD